MKQWGAEGAIIPYPPQLASVELPPSCGARGAVLIMQADDVSRVVLWLSLTAGCYL